MRAASGRHWPRTLTLTMGLTIAASLTLGYLGLRAVGDREQSTRVHYEATSALIRDRIRAELSTLDALTGRHAASLPSPEATAHQVQEWLRGTGVAPTWTVEPLLIREQGGVATAQMAFGWAPSHLGVPVGTAAFAAAIQDGERHELAKNDLDQALASYRQSFSMAEAPQERGLANSRVGRVLSKLSRFESSIAAYRDVLTLPPGLADPNGIPYAVTARLQIADGWDALDRRDDSRQARVDLAAWMLDHPWDGRDGYGYYLSRLVPALSPTDMDLAARVERRIAAVDDLEWIDRVIRPKLEADAHTSPSGADATHLVAERHGLPVFVTAQRRTAPAAGSTMWMAWVVGREALEPLLATVLDGIDLGPDLSVAVVDRDGRDVRTAKEVVSLASADLAPFTGWQVAILDVRGRTIQQLGARERWVYGALVLGTIVVLLAGLLIAARAWAREAELSRLRADFVSNVSHELKTPLSLIRMFGETLESGLVTDPSRQHEFHGIIRRESERLTHLINNVLDIAKIDAGTKRFDLSPSDLTALVVETLDAYAPLLKQLGFTVSADVPRLPIVVQMDRNAVAQALVNLFQNAIKYSRDNRWLAVSLTTANREVRVSVSDRGLGIAAGEIPRIFAKYYRVPSTDMEGTAGSGLGLAIVEHAMAGHGGRVEVASVRGEGSTFTLIFPGAGAATESPTSTLPSEARKGEPVSDVAVH